MRLKLLLSFFAAIAGLLINMNMTAQNTIEAEIRKSLVKDPTRVLEMLDTIEKEKTPPMPQHKIDMLRALAYNELRRFSLKEIYIKKVIENDSISFYPKAKLQAMTMLLDTESFYGKIDESAAMTEEAIKLARELGNKPAELHILQSISTIYFKSGDKTKGYKYIREIIDNYKESDNIRILAGVSSAYGELAEQLINDGKLTAAAQECRNRLEVIRKIDAKGGAPAGFTDQQKAYTYAKLASAEERAGHKGNAAEACKMFLSTDYGNTLYGKVFITDYLLESGKYKDVISFTAPLFEVLQKADTINSDYFDLLTCNAAAYYGSGKPGKAYELSKRAAVVQDSLNLRERRSRAIELATTFKMQEQELALVKSEAELQRKQILILMAFGVALIILIGLLILIRQYHFTLQRNRIAAKQIDELMAQKEQFYKFQPLAEQADNSKDYADFARMEKNIVENSLFLKRNFNRDAIADECHIPRTRVVMLIQKYAGGTPGDYINKLKVQYSVKLIKEHKEWTIDAIAEAAGYSNRSTYYQNFFKLFAITPAQYRRQIEESESELTTEE